MKIFLQFSAFLILISFPLYPSGNGEKTSYEESFNQSLEHYHNGEWDTSLQLLNQLPQGVEKLELISSIYYKMAEQKMNQGNEIETALKNVKSSIGNLSRVLEINPESASAANNLEMALLLKEKLQDMAREQTQSNSGEETLQDELEQLAQNQRELAQDSAKEDQDHKENQEDLNNATEELNNRANQDDSGFNENLDKAREAQNEASEALENGDFNEASTKQNEAADYLEQALNQLMEETSGDEGTVEKTDSEEKEGDELIQSILETEKERDSENKQSGEGIAVERNW